MMKFTDNRFSWTIKLLIITCLCFLASHQTDTYAAPAPAGVQFENRILEKVVRNALNKPQVEITIKDMASLKEISTNFDHITSLKGLEYAVNLTSLYMVNSKISDLSPISGLHQLKSINLTDNYISDLSPLNGLNKVVEHR